MELITRLTTLLDHWNTLAAAAAQKIEATAQPLQGGFYAGVMHCMKTTHDKLFAGVAKALAEVVTDRQ